jgi:SOS-response transcriptional repressor LexA
MKKVIIALLGVLAFFVLLIIGVLAISSGAPTETPTEAKAVEEVAPVDEWTTYKMPNDFIISLENETSTCEGGSTMDTLEPMNCDDAWVVIDANREHGNLMQDMEIEDNR